MSLSAEWRYVGSAALLSSFNVARMNGYTYKVYVKSDPLSPTGRIYKVMNPKTERSYDLRSVAPITQPTFKTAYQTNPLTGTPWLFHVVPKGFPSEPPPGFPRINFPS